MARKRMIDPAFWQSEDVSCLSMFERLVFIGLFSLADDEGRGRANPRLLCSEIFPYDRVEPDAMASALSNIARRASIVFYEVDGCGYYALLSWTKWQKVDKPRPSLIPPCPEASSKTRRGFVEDSSTARGTLAPNRIEQNRSEEKENIKENKEREIKEEIPKEEKRGAGAESRACEPAGTEAYVRDRPAYAKAPARNDTVTSAPGREGLIRLFMPLPDNDGDGQTVSPDAFGRGDIAGAPSGGP